MSDLGYRSGRYTLVKRSGRVRHSTPDIVDARNGLALRYGLPCLLLEGRQTSRREGQDERLHVQNALAAALDLAVGIFESDESRLTTPPAPARPGDAVVIRSRYAQSQVPFLMSFRNLQTSSIEANDLGATYSPRVEATRLSTIPRAYIIPQSHRRLLDLLERQGFPRETPDSRLVARVECDHIQQVHPSRRRNRPPRVEATRQAVEERSLSTSVLFPTNHEGGRALAVLLESDSKYGLGRFADLGLTSCSDSRWPVLRVL